MNIVEAINLNKQKQSIEFLLLSLVNNLFSTDDYVKVNDYELISKLFMFEIPTTELTEKLSKSTYVEVELNPASNTNTLYFDCEFKGHGGYPGGLKDKSLGSYSMQITPDALNYLLFTNRRAIEEAEDKYYKDYNNDNQE